MESDPSTTVPPRPELERPGVFGLAIAVFAGIFWASGSASCLLALFLTALAMPARAADVEFVVDDEMLIKTLCERGALEDAAAGDAQAVLALQNRMWALRAPYDVLNGSWTPAILGARARPEVRAFVDTVRGWPEFAALRRRAEARRDFCRAQWTADRARSETFLRGLTGLALDGAYRVAVLHSALAGSQNMGGRVIRWGGREEGPHYTTVYVWHEILHDHLPRTEIGHALIQLACDRELRRYLDPRASGGYSGHPELRDLTASLMPGWERYMRKEPKRIVELCAELTAASAARSPSGR